MIYRNEDAVSMILGIGSYLPDEIVTNHDLSAMMDTSDEWILARTGVSSRRRAAPHETTSSMAIEAATKAVEDAGLSGVDIDLIIMGTMFPDFTYPGPGMLVQERLCAPRTVPAIDIRAQCAGFIFALSMADLYIRSGQVRHVLVVFAEKEFDHYKVDRQVGVIFGDGAGAAVLGPATAGRGIIATSLQGDGTGVPNLVMTSDSMVGLRDGNTVWPKELHKARSYWEARGYIPGFTKYPFWVGQEVFRNAVRRLTRSAKDILDICKISIDDVDHFFFHQANARINGKIKEMLRLADEKVPENIQRIGNTGAASVVILMDEARRQGCLRPGDICLLSAFGAGYLWGSALLRY